MKKRDKKGEENNSPLARQSEKIPLRESSKEGSSGKKRKLGYAFAGLAIGVSSYLFLQAGTPEISTAKAELIEFEIDENFSNFKEKDSVIRNKLPILEYGGYYYSNSALEGFEENGVVRYGKSNPSFFYKKEVVKKDEEGKNTASGDNKVKESGILSGSSDSEETATNVGGVDSRELEENLVSTAEAFDVSNYEIKEEDVSFISRDFYENGVLPVGKEYYNKTSGYGVRMDPFEPTKAYHAGLDLAAAGISGKEIYAVLDGVVKSTKSSYASLGNTIMLEHNGFQTSYSHMILPSFLKEGDVVRAGDVIGYVGSTGRSTGPHLHFEVGIDNLRFDPEIFTQYIKGAK